LPATGRTVSVSGRKDRSSTTSAINRNGNSTPRSHPVGIDSPGTRAFATTSAFGLGLSYATEVPEVEVALEDSSKRLLIYWVWEVTFARPGARWAASVRLHHRSTGFGLMAEDGGMNAMAAGVRFEF
jgi:hypothetical protein